jgi:hypothetical protein
MVFFMPPLWFMVSSMLLACWHAKRAAARIMRVMVNSLMGYLLGSGPRPGGEWVFGFAAFPVVLLTPKIDILIEGIMKTP